MKKFYALATVMLMMGLISACSPLAAGSTAHPNTVETSRAASSLPQTTEDLATTMPSASTESASPQSTAQSPFESGWVKKSSPSAKIFDSHATVCNGKLYIVSVYAAENQKPKGGPPSDAKKYTKLNVYDPTTDVWTELDANLKQMSDCFSVCTSLNRLYILGSTQFKSLEAYDPETNLSAIKSPIAYPRGEVDIGEANGRIYAIAGYSKETSAMTPTGIIEEYDPSTDTWTRKTDMPTARAACCVETINNKIYVIGGVRSNAVEVYDPVTETWQSKKDVSEIICDGFVMNGSIYARSAFGNNIYKYDEAKDEWNIVARFPANLGRTKGTSIYGINNKVYIFQDYFGDSIGLYEYSLQ